MGDMIVPIIRDKNNNNNNDNCISSKWLNIIEFCDSQSSSQSLAAQLDRNIRSSCNRSKTARQPWVGPKKVGG